MMKSLGKFLLIGLAIIIAVITLAPALWMLSASFMTTGEASAFPPKLLPARMTFEHYFTLFTRLQLSRYLVNSLILSVSDFRIYWRVILPLCKPILITLAIFTFMGTWNDFLWPLIVMTDDSMYTLPVALANLSGEHVQDTELMMAGAVMTILPVMIIFIALQKYYISGIMAGGMKG